ncbi:Acetyltransferase (GNAT) domain-containing protein [Halobacillus alkaliphilus]|uniref:Acetyltransferase (GNAT) domain-containing protein n=1 Tax=Halobacillus alkaliphilus TaxID=396056 RepID=A0A1I2QB26_9BACI|nr:GNAT family N-acetyltransferase [Halobacillus alkaliphilus]SFG24579.1 Acetyltransferase (GNAT) domain-containing protein [Halobacillus alkaliphilus]
MLEAVKIVNIQKSHLQSMYLWELDKEIQKNAGIEHPRTYEHFLNSFAKYFRGEKPQCLLRAVEVNGILLGKIELFFDGDRNYLGIVLASQRNQGVGTKALNLFLEEIKQQRNVNKVYVEVFDDNERSLHFFQKNWFVYTGESTIEWYRNQQRKLMTLVRDI